MTSKESTIIDIRSATDDDLPAILAIYNQVIRTSTAIYSEEPVTLENRRAWFYDRRQSAFPVLVAVENRAVIGFASFAVFRSMPGYRHTVEHSVHVREDCRGRGIGKALVSALFPIAANLGKHVMVGGIDAQNEASLRLHARLGFIQAAHFQEVGWKFGRWLDLVFMQRFL